MDSLLSEFERPEKVIKEMKNTILKRVVFKTISCPELESSNHQNQSFINDVCKNVSQVNKNFESVLD